MSDVEETKLPGVGVRHDFVTAEGDRIGVLAHRTGRRELLIYDKADPDACSRVVLLDSDDTHTLAEVLGASRVSESLATLQQNVEGLTIDWITVEEGAPVAGLSLRDAEIRGRTGVSVVAVLRHGTTIPSPDPDFTLLPGDTAITVGTAEGTHQVSGLLHRS